MTKRIIALILALAAAAVLLAGCELRLGPEQGIDIPTLPELSPEDLALLSKLNEDGDDDALNRALLGLLPPGFTLAADQEHALQPNMLPEGEAADKAELLKLVKKVQDTFNSGTFYLKGRGNNMMDSGGGSYAPMTLAVDQDKMMIETDFDWGNMMKTAYQEQGEADVGQSKLQASIAQTLLGSKMRMLYVDNTVYMLYPEKKRAANLSAFAEGEDGLDGISPNEMINTFDQFGSKLADENDLKATRVKDGKNEYLCATYTVDEDELGRTTMKYYFLKGELKRLEVASEQGNSVFEIDTFSGRVDSSLFSTKGYAQLNMGDMAKLTGLLNF